MTQTGASGTLQSMSSASSQVIHSLCLQLNSAGENTAEILTQAGVDPSVLNTPAARISETQLQHIWALASKALNQPTLGLTLGFESQPQSLGILGYVLNNAANVRQAYSLLSRYRELVFDEVLFTLTESPQEAIIQLRRDPNANAETSRPLVEYLISVLIRLCGTLTGGGHNFLQRVDFRHSEPSQEVLSAYQQYFGIKHFVFNCHETGVIFNPAILDQAVTYSDPSLLKLLTDKADAELKSLATETQLVNKVNAVIKRRMLGQTPSIIKTAEDCAMSRASLQRHLAKAGTSFQALLDEARRSMALELLAEPNNSVAHVAFMLGYGDSAAFYHAFKRWTGLTPTQFRQQQATA